jgi:hypothetical protein
MAHALRKPAQIDDARIFERGSHAGSGSMSAANNTQWLSNFTQ